MDELRLLDATFKRSAPRGAKLPDLPGLPRCASCAPRLQNLDFVRFAAGFMLIVRSFNVNICLPDIDIFIVHFVCFFGNCERYFLIVYSISTFKKSRFSQATPNKNGVLTNDQ